ncbi:MAG: Lrp/AsnC family transcriptional regulator [Dysgonamonadaceae bacterium]|jgi:Lrp/AsnC family transcriptional regulator for asnA, asnC and gidA|nr:Lrp/AsnC family transcriptional regulator [Dysgonamonadaceae bacterium]
MAYHELDELDEKILNLIVNNARIPFLEVARECNVSGAAIHQRVQRLTAMGVLKGSKFIVDMEKIGYTTCAYIGLFLSRPDSFDVIADALENIPEVSECHYTTGRYDLLIKVYAKNNHELLRFVQQKILPLGLARTETLVCLKESIKRKLPLSENTEKE